MLADRLARYAHTLSFEHLPYPVVHEVKRRLLDSFACAFGAWDAEPCTIVRRIAQSVQLKQGATVWGTSQKTLPDLATFANGTLVRFLDFNDTYLSKEPAHPSDNLAAVLAAGETIGASGQKIIEAAALAYEIHCRLCDAAALRPRGWDHVTYGAFSSALAVAKVLGLQEAQMLQAINLAGVANVALRQTRVGHLSMWKACAFANAARNGVFAAYLAREGMIGPSPIFEGEKGFMALVSGSFDLPQLGGEFLPPSGQVPFKILDTYIKAYPVEYHAQTAVEAALAVRSDMIQTEGPGVISRIQEIEIGSYDVAIEIIGRDPEKWHPTTRETADHSFPYCVAVALLDGQVTVDSFNHQHLQDPLLQQLMQKIRVVAQPELTDRYPQELPTRLRVWTTSGKEYHKEVTFPRGHPRNPLSDQEIEAKFCALAAQWLNRSRIDQVIRSTWNLESTQDIREVLALFNMKSHVASVV
ncbi:MAG: MmgE/PrpD family protein [Nitrospirae bacterium]|nr:MAG: MmgE/PrpD family protein [Nitrospirota bacterium]